MISELFHQLASNHPVLIMGGIFVVLLLCGFGLPLPEDVVLAFTGYAVHLGVMPLWAALLISMAGVLIGDSTLWWIGHRWGGEVLNLRLFKAFLPPHRLAKIKRLYARYDNRMLFAARFTPGLRSGVFLFAGWSKVTYRRFLLTDGIAALISVPLIVTVAYLLGAEIDRGVAAIRGVEHWVLAGILALILLHVARDWHTKRREKRLLCGGGRTDVEPESQGEDDRSTGTNGR